MYGGSVFQEQKEDKIIYANPVLHDFKVLIFVLLKMKLIYRCFLLHIRGQQVEDEHPVRPVKIDPSNQGLSEACKYVYNDAKYMNERARNDIVLLSQ